MAALDATMTGAVGVEWLVQGGDVWLPVARADEWGAWLEVLVAAIHHPQALAEQLPDTDAAEIATWVLDDLDDLEAAARAADDQQVEPTSTTVDVRLDEDKDMVVISPGTELVGLVAMLRTFARAVLTPGGPEDHDARGVSGHIAAAWARDIAVATGAA